MNEARTSYQQMSARLNESTFSYTELKLYSPLGVEELAVGLDGETLINAVDVSAVDINFDGRSEV